MPLRSDRAVAEPRVLIQTPKFRIVLRADGTKVLEKHFGTDAMGGDQWRDMAMGEADNVTRWLRDWIFAHAATCERLQRGED